MDKGSTSKRTLDIEGMTCAACAAHVESAALKAEGVENASVNLLKNSLEIDYDGSSSTLSEVCDLIDKAGYHAIPRSSKSLFSFGRNHTKSPAARKMKRNLIISFAFTIPLVYISLGFMFNWPLPSLFLGYTNILTLALTEFLLLLPVVYLNFRYFHFGFKALFRGVPNMDSLIALGATAAIIYGIYGIWQIGLSLGSGDMVGAHNFVTNLYFDTAAMILSVVALGKYFEERAKNKTTDSITRLMDLAPKTATLLVADKEEVIAVDRIRVGDKLVVKAGESIPIDGIVVRGSATVDESLITGESIPVEKTTGDDVVGGTVNSNGWFVMQTTRIGDETTLAKIIQLVDEATSTKAPIERVANNISRIFVPAVILIAIVTGVVWMVSDGSLDQALSCAISVLVISCPCALGLATPTAIMVATEQGALHGILIRSTESLEAAQQLETVAFGKTGTLTEGKLSITEVVPAEGVLREELLGLAASLEKYSSHPLANAICDYTAQSDCPRFPVTEFLQMPGAGVSGLIAGKECLAGNKRMMKAKGIDISGFQRTSREMSDRGKTPMFFAADHEVLGVIGISDPVKPNSARAVAELRAMDIKTVMLTGDSRRTAEAIQRQVGTNRIIAEVLPEDKEAKIRDLGRGSTIAMVGDGINDAPALARADIGIAIGASTDITKETADVVLLSNDPLDVVTTVQLGRATMHTIRRNLFWALLYNIICIPIAAGFLFNVGVTLSPMISAAAMSLSSLCVINNALRLRKWKPQFVTPEDTKPQIPAKISKAVNEHTLSSFDTTEFDRVAETGAFRPVTKPAAKPEPASAYTTTAVPAQVNPATTGPLIIDPATTRSFKITGLTNEDSANRLIDAFENIDGVESAEVDLGKERAVIRLASPLPDRMLIKAARASGFQAAPHNIGKSEVRQEQRKRNKKERQAQRDLQREKSMNTEQIRKLNRELMEELEQGGNGSHAHAEEQRRERHARRDLLEGHLDQHHEPREDRHEQRNQAREQRHEAHDRADAERKTRREQQRHDDHMEHIDRHEEHDRAHHDKHERKHEDSLDRLDAKLQAHERQRQIQRERLEKRKQQRERDFLEREDLDSGKQIEKSEPPATDRPLSESETEGHPLSPLSDDEQLSPHHGDTIKPHPGTGDGEGSDTTIEDLDLDDIDLNADVTANDEETGFWEGAAQLMDTDDSDLDLNTTPDHV